MGLARARCLHSAASGASVRGRPAAALGAALHSRLSDAGPSPSRRFGTFAGAGHARKATETLWTLAREAQRPPFGPGQALPGDLKECLSPRRPRERESFAMDMLSQRLMVGAKTPKTSLRSIPRSTAAST